MINEQALLDTLRLISKDMLETGSGTLNLIEKIIERQQALVETVKMLEVRISVLEDKVITDEE